MIWNCPYRLEPALCCEAAAPSKRSLVVGPHHKERRVSVDPRKFDALARKLSQRISRRAAVGGSISASLLSAAAFIEEALAKNKPHKDGGGKGGDGHKQGGGGDGHGGGGHGGH